MRADSSGNLRSGVISVLFETLDVLEDRVPRTAAMNMAIDEALLRHATSPLLRFYRWKTPAVSFGYFGRFIDAVQFANGRELVRRWTGGGIVPHGDDVTYSIIVPAAIAASELGSVSLYRCIHSALSSALLSHGIEATLTSEAPPKISDACFANPVAADVTHNGVKIAGAAHRRTKSGLLHQGSVQMNLDPGFGHSFAKALGSTVRSIDMNDSVGAEARQIAQGKYATTEWNRRR